MKLIVATLEIIAILVLSVRQNPQDFVVIICYGILYDLNK